MADVVSEIDGSLGLFRVAGDSGLTNNESLYRGAVVADGDLLKLKLLDEHRANRFQLTPERVPFIVGSSEIGGVVFTGCRRVGSVTNWGPNASTWYASFDSVFSHVNIDALQSLRPLRISANFYGIHSWYRLNRIEPTVDHGADGRPVRFSMAIESVDDVTAVVDHSFGLSVGIDWASTGHFDQRTLFSPVTISLSASDGAEANEYVSRLRRIEDLLSLAFEVDIRAESATAEMDYHRAGQAFRRADYWNRGLIQDRLREETLAQTPYFSFAGVGGADGLARWVSYCQEHPVVVNAVVGEYRVDREPILGSLLEIASAIEHWVVAEGGDVAHLFASFLGDVGEDALRWLRAPRPWRLRFSEIYNLVKHGDSERLDRREIREFTRIARFLLRIAIFQKVFVGTEAVTELLSCQARNSWMTDILVTRFPTIDLEGQDVNHRRRSNA